jgi:hypothetical protein
MKHFGPIVHDLCCEPGCHAPATATVRVREAQCSRACAEHAETLRALWEREWPVGREE